MNKSFCFFIIIISLCSCSNSNNKTKFYEDFDFINLKGIREIKAEEKDAYIEILENNSSKLVLRIHQRMMIGQAYEKYDKKGNCINCPNIFDSHIEIFTKKNGYISIEEMNLEQEDPFQKLDRTVYVTNKEILIFKNIRDDNKPSFARVTKIDLKTKLHQDIDFYDTNITPDVKVNFEKMKLHKNSFTFNESIITSQNNQIVHIWNNLELKTGEKTQHTTRYKGYPDGKNVNTYWNLYKYFFGSEIERNVK